MSTRSATIIRQTTYRGEEADSEELMRFYRHCDGYPEVHGIDLASSVMIADQSKVAPELWVQGFLSDLLNLNISVEFEPQGWQHGDIEYLYVVEGIFDKRWGRTIGGKLPIIISIYKTGFDEDYGVVMEREPLFSGTAYELADRYLNKED